MFTPLQYSIQTSTRNFLRTIISSDYSQKIPARKTQRRLRINPQETVSNTNVSTTLLFRYAVQSIMSEFSTSMWVRSKKATTMIRFTSSDRSNLT